jgi:hypothetical protein
MLNCSRNIENESGEPEFGKSHGVMAGSGRCEAAKHDTRDAARLGRDLGSDGRDRNARGAIRRESVDAGRDRRKRDRCQLMRSGEVERSPVARCEKVVLTTTAAMPNRADSVHDMPSRQQVTASDFGRTRIAAAECSAFGEQFRTRRTMDGAIDASAAKQRPVRRIDDGIDVERRDIGNADFKPGRADFGGKKQRWVWHRP